MLHWCSGQRQLLLLLLLLSTMFGLIFIKRTSYNHKLLHAAKIFFQEAEGPCAIPSSTTWEQFFDYVEEHQNCSLTRMFGGVKPNNTGYGAKAVCLDAAVAPRTGGGCVVLSFGINNEWSFDDQMEALGCAVHSFDPSMKAVDHQRGERVHFHKLGLSDKKTSISINNQEVPVESYRSILEHIGLINTTIDYLKIDIEGYEMEFFNNVLLQDSHLLKYVKQIGMEIHLGKPHGNLRFNTELAYHTDLRDKFWRHLHHLRCLNFRPVSSIRNEWARFYLGERQVSQLYEIVWVNDQHY